MQKMCMSFLMHVQFIINYKNYYETKDKLEINCVSFSRTVIEKQSDRNRKLITQNTVNIQYRFLSLR